MEWRTFVSVSCAARKSKLCFITNTKRNTAGLSATIFFTRIYLRHYETLDQNKIYLQCTAVANNGLSDKCSFEYDGPSIDF